MNRFSILQFAAVLLFVFNTIQAQSGLNTSDLSSVNVDELSDDQLNKIIQKGNESGMSMTEIEEMAKLKGMPESEIEKLKMRLEKKKASNTNESSKSKVPRLRKYNSEESDNPSNNNGNIRNPLTEKLFGFSTFNNKKLTFFPNLNIPTPKNYILGPGDEVNIDIWGASQRTFVETIAPDGFINIEEVGLINLSGITLEDASSKITQKLEARYGGLRGDHPVTFAKISLGSTIRSIKVNILGNASVPGTYSMPALANIFTALYMAGGPSVNGSLRNIKISRHNKSVTEIDLYDFLLTGKQPANLILEDQDVVYIGTYQTRVSLEGELKQPGVFDVRPNEKLGTIIKYAGMFTEKAYLNTITVTRCTSKAKKVINIQLSDIDTFSLKNGDQIEIGQISNTIENGISIQGAVSRPGQYAYEFTKTLKQLIKKADGLKGDASMFRTLIYRKTLTNTTELIPINLNDILKNEGNDIDLKNGDIVYIPSSFSLREPYTIQIDGAVQSPGVFEFQENCSIKDLVLKAGGFLESASLASIDVARRIKSPYATASGDSTIQTFSFPIDKDLLIDKEASEFTLKPFDVVFVRRSPGYKTQKIVSIDGQVEFPGAYVISKKNERLSSLIKRAGGITSDGYIKGAKLYRNFDTDEETYKRLSSKIKDSLRFETQYNTSTVAINLEDILKHPDTERDIVLQEGDRIVIPKDLQTVKVSGAVYYPMQLQYQSPSLSNYLNQAGGITEKAKSRKICVIYPNGSVKVTKSFFFIKKYPKIVSGAEIVVPQKVERKRMTLMESVSLVSSIASIGILALSVIALTR